MRPLERDPRPKRERLFHQIPGFVLGVVAATAVLSLLQTRSFSGEGGPAIAPVVGFAPTLAIRADGDLGQEHLLHLGGAAGARGVVGATAKLCDSALLDNFKREEVVTAVDKTWEHIQNLHHKVATRLDAPTGFDVYHSYAHFDMLAPVGPRCRDMTQLSSAVGGQDNEKKVCGKKIWTTDECRILSVGSNGEWAFEHGVVAKTRCRVDTIDCTGDFKVPEELRSRVTFHKVCLGPRDEGLYLTWHSLMAKLGAVKKAFAHVKMDIEGWEYSVLTSIIGSQHLLPEQISLELHWYTGGVGGPIWKGPLPDLMKNAHHFQVDESYSKLGYMSATADPPTYSYKSPGEMALFGAYVFQMGGYMIIDRKNNPDCRHCVEVVLAKLLC